MKKSELYRMAQMAVLNSDIIFVPDKLEVLRVLFDNEDTALYVENRDEEIAKKEAELKQKAEVVEE